MLPKKKASGSENRKRKLRVVEDSQKSTKLFKKYLLTAETTKDTATGNTSDNPLSPKNRDKHSVNDVLTPGTDIEYEVLNSASFSCGDQDVDGACDMTTNSTSAETSKVYSTVDAQ